MQTSSYQFSHPIEPSAITTLKQFSKILRSHFLFHLSMISALCLEGVTVFSLYFLFPTSTFFAFSISIWIFSFFCYIIFGYYFHARKPDQFVSLVEGYLESCINLLSPQCEREQAIFTSAFHFIQALEDKKEIWKPFGRFTPLHTLLAYWIWKDRHFLEELFFIHTIDAQTSLIKKNPLHIHLHTSLAKTYIAMVKIYKQPQTLLLFGRPLKEKFDFQYQELNKLAIEELKIIDHLSPEDLWVNAQMAFCYKNLNMKEKEIEQYEKLYLLRPADETILYRLGKLYFDTNQHADALKIYEKLFHSHPKKAQELINTYDTGIRSIFLEITT